VVITNKNKIYNVLMEGHSSPKPDQGVLRMISRIGKSTTNHHLLLLKQERPPARPKLAEAEKISVEEYFALMGNNRVDSPKAG
jgi:hypothetical protein